MTTHTVVGRSDEFDEAHHWTCRRPGLGCHCTADRRGDCRWIGDFGGPKARTIVVDPSDPATIERAARAIWEAETFDPWNAESMAAWPDEVARCRAAAAAVLASLTSTGDNEEQGNAG